MIQLGRQERTLLVEAAAREGISRSELVRRALRAYVANSADEQLSERLRQGYLRLPEADDEAATAAAAARRLLTDPDLPW